MTKKFFEGMGRVFDLFGLLHDIDYIKSDQEATVKDLDQIGKDGGRVSMLANSADSLTIRCIVLSPAPYSIRRLAIDNRRNHESNLPSNQGSIAIDRLILYSAVGGILAQGEGGSVNDFDARLTAKYRDMYTAIGHGSLAEKALYLIENLLPDDEEFKPFSTEHAADILSRIYTYAHSACTFHTCYDVHDSWREQLETDFKNMVIEEAWPWIGFTTA